MASPYTGEARYRLVGRPDDVAPFVRVARVMLAELSEDMARNDLKIGVLRRSFHVGTEPEGVTGLARIQVKWINGQAELTIVVDRETSNPKQEKEEKERKPYLWVGVRHKFLNGVEGFYPMYGIYVTEPGENGILHDPQYTWWGLWATTSEVMLDSLDLDRQDERWAAQGPTWNIKPGRYFYQADDCESMFFTKNLMRMYRGLSFAERCIGNSRIEEAHDPMLTPEEAASVAASRAFPDGLNYTRLAWDSVVVLDPDEGGAPPTSRRESDLEVVKILSKATGTPGTGRVLPGLYAINILDAEDSCWLEQPPLDLLVEVRVNKAPHTITKQFDVTIGYGSWDWENVVPFGSEEESDQCTSWGGPNKRRECWWPSTIMVDVLGGTINLSDFSPDWFEPSGGPVARACSRQNTVVLVGLVAPWGMGFVEPEMFDETMRTMACGMRWFYSGMLDPSLCTELNTAEFEAALRSVFAPNKYAIALFNLYTKEIQEVSWDVPELNPTTTGACTHQSFENYYRIRTRAFGPGSYFGKYIYGCCGPTYDNWVYPGDPPVEPCAVWISFPTLLATL